jgi:hypothetical protein
VFQGRQLFRAEEPLTTEAVSCPPRIPTVRRRFVTRTRYLLRARAFHDDVELHRNWRNEHFPDFALPGGGWPPDLPFSPGDLYVYPAKVAAAAEEARAERQAERDGEDGWMIRTLERTRELELAQRQDPVRIQVKRAWEVLVESICASWWPPVLFPSWVVARGTAEEPREMTLEIVVERLRDIGHDAEPGTGFR